MGATEANPLGLGVLPVKALLTAKTRSMAFSDCVSWRGGLDVMRHAPGAANVATLAVGNPGLGLAVFLIAAMTRSNYAYDTATRMRGLQPASKRLKRPAGGPPARGASP